MIAGIDHVNIVVKNLDKSISFYKTCLGFTEKGRKKLSGQWIEDLTGIEGIKAEVSFLAHETTSVKIELLKYYSPEGESFKKNSIPNTPGIRHLAFKTDNFDAMVNTLKQNRVTFLGQPQSIPNPTEKYKSKICYFYDPDGVLLEITGY